MRWMLLTITGVLAGCATNSGVVSMGQDRYMIARQAATGFSGLGNLKSEAIAEGSSFCAGMGRQIEVGATTQSEGPYVLGNYPRVEIQFECRADCHS